jgi:hypothetical protein
LLIGALFWISRRENHFFPEGPLDSGEGLIDLFRNKKSEDRIIELQSALEKLQKEKDDLSRALENREEKIRKLSSAYQEANLALKAAEQKSSMTQASAVTCLEEGEKARGQKVRPLEICRLLKKLKAFTSPEVDLTSAYITSPEAIPPEMESFIKPARSDRGWIVFRCPQLFTLTLVPPLPIIEGQVELGSAFHLDTIKEMLEIPALVISAHAGDTLIGIALSPGRFEVQEAVKSQVKEKHSKGGWSQKRFERLREEDIRNHAEVIEEKLKALMEIYGPLTKVAVVGGDQAIIKQIIPAIKLPVVERRLERHDSKHPEGLLEEVYGFTCYRS